MLQHVRVAAAAIDAKPGETGHNLDSIELWAHRAADGGASLLLLPELSLSGFLPNHPAANHEAWLRDALAGARRMAEPIDGPAVRRLCAIARDTGLLIAAGLLEDAGSMLFNTHVLAGPTGVLGAWRKMHVPLFEMPLYNGGGAPPVVDTPLGRIGITICIDAFLPESVRLLAVQGAEIVLFPFAADPAPLTPEGWSAWAEPTLRARCLRERGVRRRMQPARARGVCRRAPGVCRRCARGGARWRGDRTAHRRRVTAAPAACRPRPRGPVRGALGLRVHLPPAGGPSCTARSPDS